MKRESIGLPFFCLETMFRASRPCGESWRRGVIPHIELPWKLEDKRGGLDSGVKKVKDLIQNKKATP